MTKPLPHLSAPAHLCGTFRPATPVPLIRERALFVVAALPKPGGVQPVITEEARARNAARVAELFPAIVKAMPRLQE